MAEPDSEHLRRRGIEQLIDLIYSETDKRRRAALVALLAEEESKRRGSAKPKPSGGIVGAIFKRR